MAVSVVMPALEMAQETGQARLVEEEGGRQVKKGEMLLEVETDKAVVEIEAQADGILGGVTAKAGRRRAGRPDDRLAAEAGEQPPATDGAGADRPARWTAPLPRRPLRPQRPRGAGAAGAAAAGAHLAEGAPARQGARRRHQPPEGLRARRRDSSPTTSMAQRERPRCAPAPGSRAAASARPLRRTPASTDARRARLHRQDHGRAHDAELDDGAALLRHARGRLHGARSRARERLAPAIEQSHGVKLTLHRSAGRARRARAAQASAA